MIAYGVVQMETYEYTTLVDPVLTSLEDKYNVDVVGAWAIGARARGTSHRDSDIDVMAVACNKQSSLVTNQGALYRKFDTFDHIGTGVDVQLWSLRGVYDGVLDDNPTIIHALDSSEHVTSTVLESEWFSFEDYVLDQMNTYALLHHYRSLAKQNYRKYIENNNDPTVSRLFFVTDALCRAWYIEETGSLPSYDVDGLSSEMIQFDDSVGSYIKGHSSSVFLDLISLKKQGDGEIDYFEVVDEEFVDDIEREIDRSPRDYDQDLFGSGVDPDITDSLLRRVAESVWDESQGAF